ncbi:GNAT family N-acetyltransferase [Paraferrimonas sp. SM1919]|uniref:GNAT family N-acetyltransferase n=1 Tax=Paraferrimonas sp. SM1919 TaxID=2662263 RepID=UPI0013D19D03|nr:GNAT family N-acetyltransferase [Paraferrimonas sp. SM1919]
MFTIKPAPLEDAIKVHQQIPEFDRAISLVHLQQRLQRRPFLCLVAYVENQPVGYKLGYQQSADTFYSWLGGVIPSMRKVGVAQSLLEQQQTWARAQGYRHLTVKSMFKYPNMLKLLERNGYKQTGFEDAKLSFSKPL